jgi:hypothetical protein
MPRLPGLDPEVLADLRRREESERDPSRSRTDPTSWTPPAIVEHWPCRGGCNTMVGVTREAVDARNAGNAMLARRREKPIGRHEVVWCDDCNSRRRMT